MNIKKLRSTLLNGILIAFFLPLISSGEAETAANKINSGLFELEYSERGITSLKRAGDLYPTDYILGNSRIGEAIIAYRTAGKGGEYAMLRDGELEKADGNRLVYRLNPPYVPFLRRVKITASAQLQAGQVLVDPQPVPDSKSRVGGYVAFRDRKGTTEWVQYEFPEPAAVSATSVFWLDDSALNGPYKAPAGWRLLYRDESGNFRPVRNPSGYGLELDRFNRVSFEPVRTTAMRLEMTLRPTHSAGLYRWLLETDAEEKIRREHEEQKRRAAKEIRAESVFEPRGKELLWTVSLENLSDREMEIADLGLPLPFNTQYTWDKEITYNLRVIRHFLVAGQGSFVFCQRTNTEPPYLVMIPVGGTGFEYYDDAGRGVFCPYVHSKRAAEEVKKLGGRWRFENTAATLAPRGKKGSRLSYSFKFLWAEDGYRSVREILFREGLFDVMVIPGMVVPENLDARLAVRTKNRIVAIEPEFPAQTDVEEVTGTQKGDGRGGEQSAVSQGNASASQRSGYRIFRIKFSRLGENLITIKCADGKTMPLEFFVTEDLETLFRKRSSFLVRKQQHRDPSKWYYGVYSDWDMKNKVLRSADDRDGLQTWLVDACDDAGNARPAFVASKNVFLPMQEEVAGVDLYIRHYLWGGMQMTEEEQHPFAIYGIPNWKVNRESYDPGRNGRLHVWRIYDYPHIVLLYYRMYQIARLYPEIKTELKAEEYLRRAYRTAIAYFTVPLEVEGWSAYGTPTMNEIVINELIEALEGEGWKKEAAELRRHWEKKVIHFICDEPYLFGSEFAFDSTGFEATGAMARYALTKLLEGRRPEEEKRKTGKRSRAAEARGEDAVVGSAGLTESSPEKKICKAKDESEGGGKADGDEPGLNEDIKPEQKDALAIREENLRRPEEQRNTGIEKTGANGGVKKNEGESKTETSYKEISQNQAANEAEEQAEARESVGISEKVNREKAEKFLEKQLRLNVAARGWLETAYYYLGSDYRAGGGLRYTLSYMSQMGGWSVLDYALWWAKSGPDIFDYLRLGYASNLSSWALMNTGRPETDYGFWYPGPENDGASGGGFEPLAWARGWNGKWIPRGCWNYSSEQDVGYCGAVRTAATIVAEDPIFGLVAFGGKLEEKEGRIEVIPRDGLRVRFHYVKDAGTRLHFEFQQGRLAKERPVMLAPDLSEIRMLTESRLDSASGVKPERSDKRSKSDEVALRIWLMNGDIEYEAVDEAGRPLKVKRLNDGSFLITAPAPGEIRLFRR